MENFVTAELITELRKKNEKPEGFEEYTNFKYYSDDDYPAELIDKLRPNEHPKVRDYRRETYQPVFCEIFERIMNSLQKIQRADGFVVKFPPNEYPQIAEDETLEHFLTYQFGSQKSLMRWCFNIALKQYIIGANSQVVVWAKEPASPTEYRKPYATIIPTPYILKVVDNEMLIWCNEEVYEYSERFGQYVKKAQHEYYSIDKQRFAKWKVGKYNKVELVEEIPMPLDVVPFFALGGVIEEEEIEGFIGEGAQPYIEYQSRMRGILPWLNVATVEFSDLRAEITMHQNSTMWIYEDQQCPSCNGMGYVTRDNQKVRCTNTGCVNGQIPSSPFDIIRIRPAKENMGETAAPTPPAGYVQKQTEIAKLQADRIEGYRYKALAAVNMQFLDVAPAAQSGVAKAYDRDETNNTFYGVATDIARIYEGIADLCARWRYKDMNVDIMTMLPKMLIPNTFDVVGAGYLVEEMKMAKDSGINDAVLAQIEKELIRKRFVDQPKLQRQLFDAYDLDPMSGMTEDEKAMRVSNRGASKQDYIISSYITDFVRRAYEEDAAFGDKTSEQKLAVLRKYADEKMRTVNSGDKVFNKIFNIGEIDTSTGASPADLKYTVGGLTGLIEVVKAVASGVYDLDAAVNLLMDRFGLTEEQARAQLGTPQVITNPTQADNAAKLI